MQDIIFVGTSKKSPNWTPASTQKGKLFQSYTVWHWIFQPPPFIKGQAILQSQYV